MNFGIAIIRTCQKNEFQKCLVRVTCLQLPRYARSRCFTVHMCKTKGSFKKGRKYAFRHQFQKVRSVIASHDDIFKASLPPHRGAGKLNDLAVQHSPPSIRH